MRDGDGRFGQPVFPRSRSGSESEAELSQSLALTKTRSYGSTASVTAPLTEKYIEHRVSASDTLQGIALRYGVTKMAEFSPVLPLRDGDGRFGQPVFPRSRSGSESEAELSQSLALTKTRSYGSTASVTAPLTEKYIEHRVSASDTLQGIALRYGVTKMAEFSPVLPLRDGDGRFGQPVFPRSRSGSESEAELSQSLALTKTRSYGSTASVTAPLTEKYIEHRVSASDTLQGIALRYGVTLRRFHILERLSSSVELNGEQLFGKNQEDQEKMETVTH
ncbi:UNVERIFIED_CONTAM: hypothetical protein FKN15_003566 [Acipenser sinensis]